MSLCRFFELIGKYRQQANAQVKFGPSAPPVVSLQPRRPTVEKKTTQRCIDSDAATKKQRYRESDTDSKMDGETNRELHSICQTSHHSSSVSEPCVRSSVCLKQIARTFAFVKRFGCIDVSTGFEGCACRC